MLESFKKFMGLGSHPSNPEGLPEPTLKLLREEFQPLDKLQAGLAGRVLGHVVDGTGDDVLLALRGLPDAGGLLRMCTVSSTTHSSRQNKPPRCRLTEEPGKTSAAVLLRLGQIYRAMFEAAPSPSFTSEHLPAELRWLEVLLCELSCYCPYHWYYYGGEKKPYGHISDFRAMLRSGGHADDALARHCLYQPNPRSTSWKSRDDLRGIEGLGDYLAEYPELILESLGDGNAAQRESRLELLQGVGLPLNPDLLRGVAGLAVGPAKRLREQAQAWLHSVAVDQAPVREEFRRRVTDGSPAERKLAAALVLQDEGTEVIGFLRDCQEKETVKSVAAVLEKLVSTGAAVNAAEATASDVPAIPPAKAFERSVKVTAEIKRDLLATMDRLNADAIRRHAEQWDRTDPKWRKGKRDLPPPVDTKQLDRWVEMLAGEREIGGAKIFTGHLNWQILPSLEKEVAGFFERTRLPLVARIRLMRLFGITTDPRRSGADGWNWTTFDMAVAFLSAGIREDGCAGLRDLAAAFEAAGVDPGLVGTLYTEARWGKPWNCLDLGADQIWPYFADRLGALEAGLGLRPLEMISDYLRPEYAKHAYQILATFPVPPVSLLPALWERALEGKKVELKMAQECLTGSPGRDSRIIEALQDGKKSVRTVAAEWLGELRVADAETPLLKAIAKEKADEPKAAMMETLEKLGVDIERFLNRKQLQAEAEKALAKGIPKGLEWFPFDRLPEIRWEKNRQRVPDAVLRFLILQAFKLKNPEPGPLLRRYAGLMEPQGRKALGDMMLQAWLAEDTRPAHTPDEAAALADRDTAQMKSYAASHPQWYSGWNEASHRAAVYRHYLEECMASANPSKGVLAVAGACCDAGAVAPVAAYLKKYYGRRMAQGKALLRMLGWIDKPLAIQLILSISTRFRTKGIQNEAGLIADEIASRKNWTRDEMADRTIPSGGFEEDGTQVIDYGSRQFTARLLDDFSIELRNGEGRVIKALPDATKAEDADEVKLLKKGFSSAKKEIKEALKMQKERLYEAMCTGREWRFEDWDMFLNRHPVVGRYCQRLVWSAARNGEPLGQFRPMPDRTLTDADDEAVALEPDDLVMLAHRARMEEPAVAAWRTHLEDYEVPLLFPQLDVELLELGGDARKRDEILDFEGHLITTFRLRAKAGKRGYTRGQAEDGGWFYTYHKRFPGLGIEAVIEFTGNGLPEEDRTVALTKLAFTRLPQDDAANSAWNLRPLRLGELPQVLVSECWNDLQAIAADGTGFDADWRKKSEF
ncbi:DUF4132 domain-containing protein [Luteolibacter marinus]|uniref:DUF4132 domain-containing protein n=1 Tax=Luteolibacter marinus TaxID=2776705 RepID=UPI0018694199|nr:DUF4132 domain-containing protein [Luteolibacter marinus]